MKDGKEFLQKLVFDNQFKYKFLRHLLFWIAIFSYFSLQGIQDNKFNQYVKINLIYLPLDIITTYILIYFIYPKILIKKQYLLSFIYFLLLLIFHAFGSIFIHLYIHPLIDSENLIFPILPQIFNDVNILFMIYTSSIFIKTIKYIYLIEVKNNELSKKNIENKMILLTSQLHPHFLFNTLNNLYALSVEKSEKVPENIMKLSEVIRYILYDYEKLHVKLLKEINVVKSYIEIEKLRYDSNLKIDFIVEIPDETLNRILIPPLLLFTFVENAFKHGISQSLRNAFIRIEIKTGKNILSIIIENSTDEFSINKTDEKRENIGLKNVKNRLDLYFPDKYKLKIYREKRRFIIYLEIKIDNHEN